MSLEALHTIKKDFGSCSDPRCPSFKRQSCESLNPQGPGHCQAKCLPWAGSLSFTGLRAVTDDQLRDLLLFPHAHLVLFPNASSSSPLWSVMPAPLICTNARNHSCLRGLVAPMSILQILPDNIYICVKPVVRKKKVISVHQSFDPLTDHFPTQAETTQRTLDTNQLSQLCCELALKPRSQRGKI